MQDLVVEKLIASLSNDDNCDVTNNNNGASLSLIKNNNNCGGGDDDDGKSKNRHQRRQRLSSSSLSTSTVIGCDDAGVPLAPTDKSDCSATSEIDKGAADLVGDDRSRAWLNEEQIQRLLDVVDEEFEVHGRGNFPTMKVSPARLIRAIQKRVLLFDRAQKIRHVKMNGGAASYVLLATKRPSSAAALCAPDSPIPPPGGSSTNHGEEAAHHLSPSPHVDSSLSTNPCEPLSITPPPIDIRAAELTNSDQAPPIPHQAARVISAPASLAPPTSPPPPLPPSSLVSDWSSASPVSSGPPSLYGDWSAVSSNDVDSDFSDVDLIFDVDLRHRDSFDLFKKCAMQALIEFLPDHVDRSRITHTLVQDAYVKKMVKIASLRTDDNGNCLETDSSDRWSLITLNNNGGRCIELKFVDRMRRQFEFSVDSFQIHLDWLLLNNNREDGDTFVIARPIRVETVSLFGDFAMALDHLQRKLIVTNQPELIRGGGLLKYVHLLVKGYQPFNNDQDQQVVANKDAMNGIDSTNDLSDDIRSMSHRQSAHLPSHRPTSRSWHSLHGAEHFWRQESSACQNSVHKMQRYMCSRFFIDFGRLEQQERKLRAYLDDHMLGCAASFKRRFLDTLKCVVDGGAICLMMHERRCTLQMIDRLRSELGQRYFDAAGQQQHLSPGAMNQRRPTYDEAKSADYLVPTILRPMPMLAAMPSGGYILFPPPQSHHHLMTFDPAHHQGDNNNGECAAYPAAQAAHYAMSLPHQHAASQAQPHIFFTTTNQSGTFFYMPLARHQSHRPHSSNSYYIPVV